MVTPDMARNADIPGRHKRPGHDNDRTTAAQFPIDIRPVGQRHDTRVFVLFL